MKARVGRWTLARRAVAIAFFVLFVLAARGDLGWFRGTVAMTRTASLVTLTDPLAAAEVVAASHGVPDAVLATALLLLGFAALFGPVFCSWVCPLGCALDLAQGARRALLTSTGHRRAAWRRRALPRGLRFGVLGGVLGFALVAGWPLFQAVSPIRLAVEAVAFGTVAAAVAIAALVVVEWFAPRLWCRGLCPLGAVYAVVGQRAPWRVRVDRRLAGRTPCNLCATHCDMGIEVMRDYSLAGRSSVDDASCTRCGACVDSCPSGVLALGFRSRGSQPTGECNVPAC